MDCLKYQLFRGVNVPYYLYYAYFYSYTFSVVSSGILNGFLTVESIYCMSYFNWIQHNLVLFFFKVVLCILMLSSLLFFQLMHN